MALTQHAMHLRRMVEADGPWLMMPHPETVHAGRLWLPAASKCKQAGALEGASTGNAQSSTASVQSARTLICQACSSETPASGVCGASLASSPAAVSTTAGSEDPCMHMLLSACASPEGCYLVPSQGSAVVASCTKESRDRIISAPMEMPFRQRDRSIIQGLFLKYTTPQGWTAASRGLCMSGRAQ